MWVPVILIWNKMLAIKVVQYHNQYKTRLLTIFGCAACHSLFTGQKWKFFPYCFDFQISQIKLSGDIAYIFHWFFVSSMPKPFLLQEGEDISCLS